jgi:predicted nucleic acid-binding protein
MILVDTSAWIEYFRATGSPAAVEVRRLLSDRVDRVAMCELVAMEILSGATDDSTHAKLEQLVISIKFRANCTHLAAAQPAGDHEEWSVT